jgi:HPt (histidine-containing phosphotransfer) domain-containing protein
VCDFAGLKDRVENDLDLLAEMIELHRVTSPKLLTEIESAVTARQGENLVRASHALKGVFRSMCANRSAEAALKLEMIGESHDLNRADQALLELKAEFEHLQLVLQKFVERMPV